MAVSVKPNVRLALRDQSVQRIAFNPKFKMASIMPGMDMAEPLRTINKWVAAGAETFPVKSSPPGPDRAPDP